MDLMYDKFGLDVDDTPISPGFNYEEATKDLDDVVHDRDIPEQDRMLQQALDFAERHDWYGDRKNRPEGLDEVEDTLDPMDGEDGEKCTLDKFWDELERRKRAKAKAMRERNKSRVPDLLVRVADTPENRAKDTDFDTTKDTREESEESDEGSAAEPESNKEEGEEDSAQATKANKKKAPAAKQKNTKRPVPEDSTEEQPPGKKAQARKPKSNAQGEESRKKILPEGRSDLMNPAAMLQAIRKGVPENVKEIGAKEEGLFDEEEDTPTSISAEELLGQAKKKKRVRPTAAALREIAGDQQISRDIPKDQRKSDQELLDIGLQSIGQANKDRWRQAPYCWNEKGFLYEPYFYLTEKRDPHTNEFIWNNEMLWKFARDHKVDLFTTRQTMPGLLTAKGTLRKRAPRQTVAQRSYDGRYIQDIPEARRLTEATRSQIIYDRQKEIKDDKTTGVQRMKKERKELEDDAMEVNERAAATWKMGTVLNQAVRAHTDELTANLATTVGELKQTKAEVAELLETRRTLAAAGQRYMRRNELLQKEKNAFFRQLHTYSTLFGKLRSHPSQNDIIGEPDMLSISPPVLRRTKSLDLVPVPKNDKPANQLPKWL